MSSLKIYSHKLKNDLMVLCLPQGNIPKVSTQLWYGVGSKDEKDKQKGIAHLIEHLIFKGTSKLSECDINMITHKLSGYTNAFTSYDYTGYLFDLPSQHWQHALNIFADCMSNATFKKDFLDSELQAVIQELKMYKDDYVSTLIEKMLSAIFPDHPYGYPIIGFKQDLWNVSRETLLNFYQYHYVPNNAMLLGVGDVKPDEFFAHAEKEFSHIKKKDHCAQDFYHSQDLIQQNVTILRDIKQTMYLVAWVINGSKQGKDYIVDLFLYILGSGKGARLNQKLVDDLQLVTELDVFSYDLFEAGVFFVYFQPKNAKDVEKIIHIIQEEIYDIAQNGVSVKELNRAIKRAEVDHLMLLESGKKLAYTIGKYYTALKDPNYVLDYTSYPKDRIAPDLKSLAQLMHPSLMHRGQVLALHKQDKALWSMLQEVSDKEDERILSGRSRAIPVEEPRCALTVHAKTPKDFKYPKFNSFTLSNGTKILYNKQSALAKIDLVVDFKIKYYYDPEDKQGITEFVANMLLEGTEKYNATEFAQVLESYGMSIESSGGQVTLSMLAKDLEKGLELLQEMIERALFDNDAIEKVRAQMLSEIDIFWDNPTQFAGHLMRKQVYKNHPYHKLAIGTLETITSISRDDLLHWYRYAINANGALISIVGDLDEKELPDVFEKYFGSWKNSKIDDIEYPALQKLEAQTIDYPIARDQVVLCYAGLSVKRTDRDYDALLLFDQIFTGGILGSMSSRLFDLREQSGLFYTIGGSLVQRSQRQPGMIVVKTIVSSNRLLEAEKAIENVIDTAIDSVTEEELQEAQQAIANSLVDNFSSNMSIAQVGIFKENYQLPDDYFDKRALGLLDIKLEEMKMIVKKWLNSNLLVKIRIGRMQ